LPQPPLTGMFVQTEEAQCPWVWHPCYHQSRHFGMSHSDELYKDCIHGASSLELVQFQERFGVALTMLRQFGMPSYLQNNPWQQKFTPVRQTDTFPKGFQHAFHVALTHSYSL
jgi:hypothetical protein